MNRIVSTTLGCLVAGLTLAAFDVGAATIRVQCEQRGTVRSTLSVEARGLPILAAGAYTAQVVSGPNMATSPDLVLKGREAEADFDSDKGDIAESATAIAGNFIVGGSATGKIAAPDGTTVISDTVACRVRTR